MKPLTKKLAIAAALVLALLVLPVAGTLSGLWWMLDHPAGTGWLLQHVPAVKVTGAKGALLGDFEAERVEFDARPDGLHLVLSGFGWRGLKLTSLGGWRQWKLSLDDLHATRVDLDLAPSKTAPKAPVDLTLPLEVDVKALRVGSFYSPLIGDKPLRDLAAQLHLGADAGALHRVDALTLAWDRLRASGSARIQTHAPLNLQAALDLAQEADADTTAWSAQATLAGPLDAPALNAKLRATQRAQPGAAHPAQTLDAQATLRPFAPWPLGDLKLTARALDLAAFSSAAPTTALNLDALAQTAGLNQPVVVTVALANSAAGRWNEARLPVRNLKLDLRGRPDDTGTLDLHTIDAELGSGQQSAGRLQGSGRWTTDRWTLDAALKDLQPALLDSRAPAMQFSGPVTLVGSGFGGANLDAAKLDLKAALAGRLTERGPARAVQLGVDATLGARAVELRSAEASAGGARATLAGTATRSANDAPWRVVGKTALVEFDPAPWWPGDGSAAWRKSTHKLNASGDFDLTLPRGTEAKPLAAQLAMLRGQADLKMVNSLLAGVPIAGEVKLRSSSNNNSDGGPVVAALDLDAAGNTLHADGRLSATGSGADDRWDVSISASALERLAPLWRLVQGGASSGGSPKNDDAPAGSLTATAQVKGRWPAVTTEGKLSANALRLAGATVRHAEAHWQMGTALTDAIDAQATLTQAAYGDASIESLRLDLQGTGRAHKLELHAESKSLPPAWTDSLQAAAPPAAGASAVAAAASSPATAPVSAKRSVAVIQAQGGITETSASPFAGWRGTLAQIELRGNSAGAAPWLRSRDIGIDVQWAGTASATVQPGRAELLGAALRWSRIAWQAASGTGAPAQLDVDAELEPVAVAPLLVRLQPDFGWGGDLAVGGHIKVKSAPTFSADVVLERSRGDLSVTDEIGRQALELTDLRLALNADNGVWNFTQALAGKTVGQLAGAVVARTTPQATWPAAETPIEGVLELQVANLGTWGTWVPAGWRLGGALRTSATIGGRFGAPEYTGQVRGTGLAVRNFLQGVNVSEGDVAIALQGSTARIEHFTARGGAGSVALTGDASLGETPRAQLKLTADKFQLLGRVDRRIVTSGSAQVTLDRSSVALDGQFGIDEGLIDFTRSDAPGLADDVEVVRARPVEAAPSAPRASTAPARSVALNLKVGLGDKLRLRGRGIDTGLRGDLRLTAPGGRLAINGNVNTADGTYAAYGQKLSIDRGLIAFSGVAENPRLDIEATRPNIDTRVGVQITGTAQNPRIRLFSEPEVSDMDKLSWLVLGRASDGLGGADTALLQQAAVALLSGEGEGFTDQFSRAIGLDAVSLRQSEGDVHATVVSLGKQLSRRWYVGYERGLNATTGTWQLIYRAAQRFTLRAQSGLDNSLDVIWTWRWQ